MYIRSSFTIIPAIIGLFIIGGLVITAPKAARAGTGAEVRSLIIGADEVVALTPDDDGSFVLPDYGVRLTVPEQWRGSVLLSRMYVAVEPAVQVVYGLLFYPPDIEVMAIQYVGALMVYDRMLWTADDAEFALIPLETDDYVFVYINSLFSIYDGLPESARYEALMLSDDQVARELKLESLK